MTNPLDRLDALTATECTTPVTVGDRFAYRSEAPWVSGEVRGTHRWELLIEVTNLKASGFDWRLIDVISDTDAPPTDARGAATSGGIAWFAVDRFVADGTLVVA